WPVGGVERRRLPIGALPATRGSTPPPAGDRAGAGSGGPGGGRRPPGLTGAERARGGGAGGAAGRGPSAPAAGGLAAHLRPAWAGVGDIVFMGILKQQGWLPGRWGGGHGYYKRFPAGDVTALLQVGYPPGGGVTVSRALFVPGLPETGGRLDDTNPKRLGEVD